LKEYKHIIDILSMIYKNLVDNKNNKKEGVLNINISISLKHIDDILLQLNNIIETD